MDLHLVFGASIGSTAKLPSLAKRTHAVRVQLDGLHFVAEVRIALRRGEARSLQAFEARSERETALHF